jgi:hypothetical protein
VFEVIAKDPDSSSIVREDNSRFCSFNDGLILGSAASFDLGVLIAVAVEKEISEIHDLGCHWS